MSQLPPVIYARITDLVVDGVEQTTIEMWESSDENGYWPHHVVSLPRENVVRLTLEEPA